AAFVSNVGLSYVLGGATPHDSPPSFTPVFASRPPSKRPRTIASSSPHAAPTTRLTTEDANASHRTVFMRYFFFSPPPVPGPVPFPPPPPVSLPPPPLGAGALGDADGLAAAGEAVACEGSTSTVGALKSPSCCWSSKLF